MRIPVFLSCHTYRDKTGTTVTIRERRLVPATRDDRIIAIIEAPAGSRIRKRQDQHGADQLLVPLGQSFWARLFGDRTVIPAKYVIGKARHGECGLRLVSTHDQCLVASGPA
jgi:hypothetical protein